MSQDQLPIASSNIENLANGITMLLAIERYVNTVGMPQALEPTGNNIRTYMLAAEEEIHEFGRELNWRPWHSGRPIDKDKALKEYSDILAFVSLLGIYLVTLTGVSPEDIAKSFIAVSVKNAVLLQAKQEGKYEKNGDF